MVISNRDLIVALRARQHPRRDVPAWQVLGAAVSFAASTALWLWLLWRTP